MKLNVHYLPQFISEADLAGSAVVVVDLLRASSTIAYALANGAKSVRAFTEVAGVMQAAGGYSRESVVLGGERGGQRIEGFDLGNSPSEYSPDAVFGQTILFTTTNGTRALEHARLAQRILVGATVNRQAIVETLAGEENIDIVCAGTGGIVTREDILGAGAIVDAFQHGASRTPNEWADAAQREWQELQTTAKALGRTLSEQFAVELRSTPGGKNLIAIGRDDDLPICAQIDVLDAAPELNQASGEIVLA